MKKTLQRKLTTRALALLLVPLLLLAPLMVLAVQDEPPAEPPLAVEEVAAPEMADDTALDPVDPADPTFDPLHGLRVSAPVGVVLHGKFAVRDFQLFQGLRGRCEKLVHLLVLLCVIQFEIGRQRARLTRLDYTHSTGGRRCQPHRGIK